MTPFPEIRPVAEQLEKAIASVEESFPKIGEIQSITCEVCEVSRSEMLGRQKAQYVVVPRHISMWLCRKMTLASLPAIGRAHHKNHSTVMHAVKNIDSLIWTRPAVGAAINEIRKRLAA